MFRKSILWKVTLGLFLIIVSGSVVLYLLVERQENDSNTDQIIRDLNNLKANTQVYIQHLLVLDGQNNDETSYRNVAQEMVQELYQVNGSYGAAYANDGELIYAMRPDLFDNTVDEDFRRAMEGVTAFTIFYPGEGQMAVTFSMPVVVMDETVGILRYLVDYSSLYRQGRETADMVLKSCLIVFAVIFLMTVLLLSGVLRPIRRLSEISRRVTEGLDAEKIDEAVFESLSEERGQDEVGRLAEDMGTMLMLLDGQFAGMREDKRRILELLQSRQEFYNNVTHELKTPLTVIQGYAGLLETAAEDEELKKKALSHIRSESERLYRMVLQLLDLARRQQPGKRTRVDLPSLVRSVCSAMEVRAGRYGMTLETRLPQELPVWAQEERLRQVFVNLLDNAIKYGREGCPIIVTGGPQETAPGKEEIAVRVENSGFLAPEKRERIFEPFYRVSREEAREKGSAGLGLSLCRQIMEEQGGRIEAECGEERVSFILYFSAAPSGEASYE